MRWFRNLKTLDVQMWWKKYETRLFTDNGWLMVWKNIWDDGWDVWGWCCMLADDEYIHENYNI